MEKNLFKGKLFKGDQRVEVLDHDNKVFKIRTKIREELTYCIKAKQYKDDE
jgi:hypothetical protein